MKSFKEFISEDGMVSAVPANSVASGAVAGIDNNPPVFGRKRKKPVMTCSPLKRSAPIKM